MNLRVVRTYDDQAFAFHDLELLRADGVRAVVNTESVESAGAVLLVLESDFPRARDILDGVIGEPQRTLRCPTCGGTDIDAKKPVPLAIMLIGLVAGIALFRFGNSIAGISVLLGSLVGVLVARSKAPAFECQRCKRAFNGG
jgi:hypothetical protein